MMPLPDYYPEMHKKEFFNISNGMQPGIYIIQAGLNIDREGEIYIKVYETKDNHQLSIESMKSDTTRIVGWSQDGQTVFPYETQLTVYEGDWNHEYEARFEIWFRSNDGNERKLAEKVRQINGWER